MKRKRRESKMKYMLSEEEYKKLNFDLEYNKNTLNNLLGDLSFAFVVEANHRVSDLSPPPSSFGVDLARL